jgi:hypothetical protein
MRSVISSSALIGRRLPRHQVAALPLDALEVAPANGRPYNADHPERPMRELVFGPRGEGTITYLLLDEAREVHILLVQWVA